MEEYIFLEEYFIEKTGYYHDAMIYSLSYNDKVNYLEYWITKNRLLNEDEFASKLCEQLEILDMAKYFENNNYNEPKLILYTGKASPNSTSQNTKLVHERLEKYTTNNKAYILATQTEMSKFMDDFLIIALKLNCPCTLNVQNRINDFIFAKAVEYHAEGNVPAIIMNVDINKGYGVVWLNDELPTLLNKCPDVTKFDSHIEV